MNEPDINRSILRMHIAAIEQKYPIRIVGLLPRGSVGHMYDVENALEFLAEKQSGLSLLDLSRVEIALGDRLGRPVGIVLQSGLKDQEAVDFPALAEKI
jgi:predicted nucleotidyltransferase